MKIRHPAHYALGGLIPLTLFLHPSIPWLLFTAYVVYEIKQDADLAKSKKKNPDSHKDIAEMVIPMSVTFILLGFLKIMGVI